MKTLKFLFVVLAVMLCCSPAIVRAELITIAISGQVTDVSDQYGHLDNQIHVGDAITGTYTYDSSAIDTNPYPAIGDYAWYATPAGISLTIDNFNFKTDPANINFIIEVCNNYPLGSDSYLLRSYHNSPLSNGALVDGISWQLDDSTGTALSSDALPLTPPDLSKWQSWFGLQIAGPPCGTDDFTIRALVTSATLVPEPATMCLLAFGGLFLRRNCKK